MGGTNISRMQKFIFVCLSILAVENFAKFADVVRDFDGDYSTAPALLSATGMYTDIVSKELSPELVFYSVNVPYWVDGARKTRYIWLPEGTQIVPNDTVGWEFPEGAVVAKNFYIDTLAGDTASEILVETRLLIKRKTRWRALNYQWRLDQTDANLVSYNAGNEVVYRRYVNGKLDYWRWRFPGSTAECITCHKYAVGVVGISAPNLNKSSPHTNGVNQLVELAVRGVLSKNVLAEKPNLMAWANIKDTTASVEHRARSWFAMNCGYCHNQTDKPVGTTHDFSYWEDEPDFNYLNIPSSRYPEFPLLIFPGKPDSSFVLKRMSERRTFINGNVDQMPPLISYLPDTGAIKVISDWICELGQKEDCNEIAVPQPVSVEDEEFMADSSKWKAKEMQTSIDFSDNRTNKKLAFQAELKAGTLKILGNPAHVSLFHLNGKKIQLRNMGNGLYLLEESVQSGVFWLQISGSTRLIRYL